MRKYINLKIIIGILIALSFQLYGILSIYNSMRLTQYNDNVQMHSNEVIDRLEKLKIDIIDVETGKRGYLLTGNYDYLIPYKKAIPNIKQDFKTLSSLTEDNPVQQDRLKLIKGLIDNRINELNHTIDIFQTKGLAVALEVINTGRGRQTMNYLRSMLNQMYKIENDTLKKQTINVDRSVKRSITKLIISGILSSLIIIVSFAFALYALSREKYLRIKSEELEARAVELAKNLTIARNTAESASRSKSQFLANMSHEVRTPINGVMGMIELLFNTPISKRQHGFLTMAQQSAESLLNIINDILDFSKIEADKFALDIFPFQLRDTVEGTALTLGMQAGEKNIELACSIAPDVPDYLLGDGLRLRQVLINLINNAIKFTEHGEVIVRVAMVENDSSVSLDGIVTLHLSVQDTGIGIPKEKQKLIFDSFSQADTSTTRKFGGTGLGLAISSQLVALMGGKIWVDSKPDIGSTFHFTSKFTRNTSVKVKTPVIPEAIQDIRVLAVDDNATNRIILKETLDNWNMNVVTAKHGAHALKIMEGLKFSGNYFDLILTDYHMPDMNGVQLAGNIRQNSDLTGIRIILLSSAGKLAETINTSEHLFDDCLMKPVRQSELLESIQRVLGLNSAEINGAEKKKIKTLALRNFDILLAEDSEINQLVAAGVLEDAGHTVTIANNGAEAIKLLGARDFDMIVMDIQMPEMDGITATKIIRKGKESKIKNPEIPIIALTAHAMKKDIKQCIDSGMTTYVSKPIRSKELLKAVNDVSQMVRTKKIDKTEEHSEEQVFNLNQALLAVDGKRKLLNDIIGMFLKICPELVKSVADALKAENPEAVMDTAHKLKGTIGNFGTGPAFKAALALEESGASGDLDKAQNIFVEVQHKVDLLVKALIHFQEEQKLS